MIQLILSILALLIGVAIYPFARKRPSLLSFLDAFAILTIIGLTFLHLIPHTVEHAGMTGIISILIGFGLPTLLHLSHHHHHSDDNNHSSLLLIIVGIGVIIHTILDGIGLSMSDHSIRSMGSSGTMLGLGVLFHRLPVGIFLSMILVPRIGLKKTWAVAITFAVTTFIGYILGHLAISHLGMTLMYAVQGLIAGALLHIVFHNVSPDGRHQKSWPKGLGAFAGIAALFIIEWFAPADHHDHLSMFETPISISELWINQLLFTAPIWCIFALILTILYLISPKLPPKMKSVADTILSYLDPQPLPAIIKGRPHIFSATGIIILFSLFNNLVSIVWWITAAIVCVISAKFLKDLVLCSDCQRESLCNRKKSIGTWMLESFTIIVIIQFIAEILPLFINGITSWIASLPIVFDYAILVLVSAGLFFYAIRKRGFTLTGTVLCMFILFPIFQPFNLHYEIRYIIFSLGIILLWLYDFHPKDIEIASESSSGWHNQYRTAAIISLFIVFSVALGCISKEPIEATTQPLKTIEFVNDYEIYNDYFDEIEREFEQGLDHKSEHKPAHHLDFGGVQESEGLNFDIPNYSENYHEFGHENHEFGHNNHHSDHESNHKYIKFIQHLVLLIAHPFHAICFLIFMLTGLYWLFKLGPRDLFFRAYHGQHHHEDHDHEDH